MSQKAILDWDLYLKTAREMVSEGLVLAENKEQALPLKEGSTVSLFGRIQNHYYKSGTGSGGMVNVSKVTGILEGLQDSDKVKINNELLDVYKAWEETHPFNEGIGWGSEPWSQEEMPLTEEQVAAAKKASDVAIVIIGRTAGEDKDSSDTPGSYRLTDIEKDMLKKVRKYFETMIVVLNVGNIIDMSFVDEYQPEAVLYAWQGGMVGGSGTADVLTGVVSPSGKFSDTVAYNITDYPSDDNFGDDERNFYKEDIYVGYRYFETFAKEKVRYPFGYGLSYTTFALETAVNKTTEKEIELMVSVTNTGDRAGKEVVQVYGQAPQGQLGKPARSLAAFAKTAELKPGETEQISITIPFDQMASYDDSGVTGHKSCYVLEAGEYHLYVGTDVRSAKKEASFVIEQTKVVEELEEALAPVLEFERMKPAFDQDGALKPVMESVPVCTRDMDEKRALQLPEEIPYTGDCGIKLEDVRAKKYTLEQFVAQFTDDDLACIIRGEGMGSSRVTAGTASAFGGVSDRLVAMGIPAVCCDDGPSGMRLDSGTKAFSLPNGTLIACSFNTELSEKLFAMTGLEMRTNKVECLLGPGMNIHRHPLNGRNFEYFSEDPYLTGIMASAQLRGLKDSKVTGTIKHFCGNNQEKRRRFTDSVVSERALREIYLKGFEIAVKEANADSIMTTYGSVNGLWTAGSYDLNTTILRKEWGFKGIVMTDWWAEINDRGEKPRTNNFAAMAKSQNDLYMVCPDGGTNAFGDNTLESLEKGTLTRAELQRNAINICGFVMDTNAMERKLRIAQEVEIINRPLEDLEGDVGDVEFISLEGDVTISLEDPKSTAGTNYIFAFDVKKFGGYRVSLKGSSNLGDLAQMTCTLFTGGVPKASFAFHGTNGEMMEIHRDLVFDTRFHVMRLFVAHNGLDLKEISFIFDKELEDIPKEMRFPF